jgi:peptide deformylase
MVIPIHVYGDPILREKTESLVQDSAALQQLIDDMFETMHGAAGIGLAAPQVGRKERVFVMDLSPMRGETLAEGLEANLMEPMACLNPEIIDKGDVLLEFEEGCLSIPDVREVVVRPERITLRFLDRTFQPHVIEVGGLPARVMQHELDHLDGVLFVDRITPLKRRLLKRRLREMARGNVDADYPLSTDRLAVARY